MTSISDYKAQILQKVQEAHKASDPLNPDARKILDVAGSEDQIADLIKRLADPATPVSEQLSALNTLGVVSNFSKVLPTQAADLVNALRGLIHSPDAEVRRQALSSLSLRGDPVAQDYLRSELQSDKPEAEKSIPTYQAIAMLGVDGKAVDKSLLLNIARNPPDEASLVQAVRHLPADKDTASVLMDILGDESKPLAARALIPDIVSNIDPGGFAAQAKQMLEEHGASSKIAPYLALGLAGIRPGHNEPLVDDTKAVVRSMAAGGSDAFQQAARQLSNTILPDR
ncbi:HEAT repeat domain-containing protein [Bradyrhizobium yuanmingense]|uniref:HEAT repeat domain-containing protein n=1 Tax=Bradyrhizobium yuanmingense TaxID=108015 RepID=UPI0023B89BEC|nr:HEAT repeat domain-containing protein [Bradyrhizobium yuanmingense]MDF0498940.1 HEAT repeat domain-containing protein [Bradyrhizobium yuanmingense]